MSTLRKGFVGKLPIVSGFLPESKEALREEMETLLHEKTKEHFKLFGIGVIPVLIDNDAGRAIIFDSADKIKTVIEYGDDKNILTVKEFINKIFERVEKASDDLPDAKAIKMFESIIAIHTFLEETDEKLIALDLISFGYPQMSLVETDSQGVIVLAVRFQEREEAYIPYDGLSSYLLALMEADTIYDNLNPTTEEVEDAGIFMPEKKIYIPE